MSFHAATVGRLTSSDEFGGDPLDNVHLDLDVDEEGHHGNQQSEHLSWTTPANQVSGREKMQGKVVGEKYLMVCKSKMMLFLEIVF